jgi:hypothetical protein
MDKKKEIIIWLLDSDPSIRWQVMKDIQDMDKAVYSTERQKLTEQGWCSEYLKLQDKDGLWSGSLYNGKWVSTTYTLYLLKILGLSAYNSQALLACEQLFGQGIHKQKEIRFSRNQEHQDLGVTGLILSMCCFFGYHQEQIHKVVDCLVDQQSKDGNWLPNRSKASEAYTFETTLLILEGLLQYRKRYSANDKKLLDSEINGQEFLLKHHLYLDDDIAIKSKWISFSFPPYWFYDVLTALDYFRAAGMKPDERLDAGIDLLNKKRNKEGKWALGSKHPGKTNFEMEKPRASSKWNTLRAMRVLKYWQSRRLTPIAAD